MEVDEAMKNFATLELGYIAWIIRCVAGKQFAIRFISVFPAHLLFELMEVKKWRI